MWFLIKIGGFYKKICHKTDLKAVYSDFNKDDLFIWADFDRFLVEKYTFLVEKWQFWGFCDDFAENIPFYAKLLYAKPRPKFIKAATQVN